jgi:hypothetical protein
VHDRAISTLCKAGVTQGNGGLSVSPDDYAPVLTLGGLARLLADEAGDGPIPLVPVGAA